MFNSSSPSLADIAAVTGNNNDFGGGNGWWVLIILLALFGGFGRGGYGYGGGGISENYTLVSDMGQIERKIDGVYSGICDSTFALNNSITNGFATANANIVQQGFETRNAITQDTIANMQGFNGIQAAVKDCCCQTQQNIKDVQYNLAQQANALTNVVNQGFCQTNFNAQQNTRDLIENQNANARAILEVLNQNKIDDLRERLAERDRMIATLEFDVSQRNQTDDLYNRLRIPTPIPSYNVPNPFNTCGCGYNNGCC